MIFIFLLIGCNAFFVAAEMALVRIRRSRIEQLVAEGNRTAEIVQAELKNSERYISACQLGITIATLALGATGEASFGDDLAKMVESTGLLGGASLHVAQVTMFVLAFSFTAFVQTVFGELLPKTFTFARAESVLWALIHPMRFWCWLTSPFLYILSKFTKFVLVVLKIPEPLDAVHTGEELRLLVTESQEKGQLEEKEEEMLHSVFDFSDTVAHEVMTPRTDMLCLAADSTVKEFVEAALKRGFSRLPVYETDVDSIFGAVHIRDALRALVEHKENTKVREFARKVLIVPENKPAADLLTDFKKMKTHIAIVVDEYGGTVGMVTIEDLLEELVGDIADEHEIEEEYFMAQPDGTFLIDAKLSLEDASEKLGLEIEDEEFNTLGGHVFGALGREPKIGDEVVGIGYLLRVEEADRHRILKLRVIMTSDNTNDDPSNGVVQNGNDSPKITGSHRAVESK
ncbi:MAG: hemolysin family protein [Candidatus Obscuribacterales bacterium]|nr:hemolysin family protein [Candidatus Obscuribacterales bacterium]